MANNTLNIGSYENQEYMLNILRNEQKKLAKRYTVRIDKNNSSPTGRITYMHDAEGMIPAHMNFDTGKFDYGDWKDVWFVKDNYPVMLKSDGTVDYKLNPNDYSKKKDGSASDITNTSYDGNAMARFPKVYLSFKEDTNYEYISVCDIKYDNNYEPIGFINDSGNEVDEIFLSIYEGSNPNSSGKLRSLSGQTPMVSQTHITEVNYAQSNGTGWYVRTWAQRQMVNALLTIISKSDNSQEAFGYGCCSNGFDIINTGTLNDKGQFFGYSSSDLTKAVKVFHIENWWGNVQEKVAGLVAYQSKVYAKMHGPYVTPGYTNIDGYVDIYTLSEHIGNGTSYGVNCKCSNVCGRLPISVGGSSSTYLCDHLFIRCVSGASASYMHYAHVGGDSLYGQNDGASYLSINYVYDETDQYTGSALSYMPQS